jgi:predicted permease
MRRFFSRLLAFVRFTRAEAELSREVDSHLTLLEDEYQRRGLTADEARGAARRAFGGVEQVKERHRAERSFPLLDDARRDVMYAVRSLRRAPVFAAVFVLTLALGVGINGTIFGVANAVLVRPLPFPAPDRLVQIWETSPQGNSRNLVSPGNYMDWREQANSLDAVGAYSAPILMAMIGRGEPISVRVTRITASALAALRVRPVVGRVFETPDLAPPADALQALISHAFWRQRFGSETSIAGSRITLNDRSYTIAGVLPAGFDFPSAAVDVWVPAVFSAPDRTERRAHNWRVIGRLADPLSAQAAEQELETIAARSAQQYPQFMQGWGVNLVSLHRDMVGDVRPLIVTVSALALTLLLAACVNLASLLLARTRRREIEFALRSAVGAGRGRLMRQVVVETLVLGAAAGGLGLLLTTLTLPALVAACPADVPLVGQASIDSGVIAVSAVLTLAATLTVALAPALRVTSRHLQTSLQSARLSGDRRAGRIRGALLVAQFAISIGLIISAGLLVRSFSRLAAVEYGFAPGRLVEAMVDLPASRYGDQVSQARFYRELIDRVRALPGVESAAVTTTAPLSGSAPTFSFAIEGRPASNPSGREDPVSLAAVSPGYFEALGVPVLQGRAIAQSDRSGSVSVVVINRALANRFWSGTNAVGRRLSFAGPGGPWYEIVGVVGDTRDEGPDKPPVPAMWIPYELRQPNWTWFSWGVLIVRARPGVEPASLGESLRHAVWSVDANLPLLSFDRVDALYAENVARRRFAMQLAVGFAGLALLLMAFGVFAVVSYGVGERTQEFGIRLALGATRGQILRPAMAVAMTPAAVGIAAGALAAAALTRWIEPLLFDVSPTDVRTFIGTAALLLALAAIAAWMPARRATLIDPVSNLRSQ